MLRLLERQHCRFLVEILLGITVQQGCKGGFFILLFTGEIGRSLAEAGDEQNGVDFNLQASVTINGLGLLQGGFHLLRLTGGAGG